MLCPACPSLDHAKLIDGCSLWMNRKSIDKERGFDNNYFLYYVCDASDTGLPGPNKIITVKKFKKNTNDLLESISDVSYSTLNEC
jgi:hypothetical protein